MSKVRKCDKITKKKHYSHDKSPSVPVLLLRLPQLVFAYLAVAMRCLYTHVSVVANHCPQRSRGYMGTLLLQTSRIIKWWCSSSLGSIRWIVDLFCFITFPSFAQIYLVFSVSLEHYFKVGPTTVFHHLSNSETVKGVFQDFRQRTSAVPCHTCRKRTLRPVIGYTVK